MKWVCALAVASLGVACGGTQGYEAVSEVPAEPVAAVAEAPLAPNPAPRPASRAASKPTPTPAPPAAREVTVPSGTSLSLDLVSAVASDASQIEDTVRATLRRPVTIGGETVLPAGAELVGTITDVERSGRVKGRARVAYSFTSLRYDGQQYTVRTVPIEHEAEATKSEDATKIGIGAGAGAVLGGILGGGDGAAKGAAIGGAAGTGAVLATRGKEVRLEPGVNVTTSLTAAVTVRVKG